MEVSDSDDDQIAKPRLEEFLECFDHQISQVNITYKNSKQQFMQDMKSFREADIKQEEQMIERHLQEGGSTVPTLALQQLAPADAKLGERQIMEAL